jgi:nicotinamide mononucleotide (NMN) deamidase PncC
MLSRPSRANFARVMGWQYHLLAHLLLVVHRPLPRVGLVHKYAVNDMQDAAKQDVRTICGIAQSNPQVPAASLVACMAIALCE